MSLFENGLQNVTEKIADVMGEGFVDSYTEDERELLADELLDRESGVPAPVVAVILAIGFVAGGFSFHRSRVKEKEYQEKLRLLGEAIRKEEALRQAMEYDVELSKAEKRRMQEEIELQRQVIRELKKELDHYEKN